MTITFFGQLTDITGKQNLQVNDVTDTENLQQHLYALYPSLQHQKFVIAVNRQIIKAKTQLDNNAEIALLPPFSGG